MPKTEYVVGKPFDLAELHKPKPVREPSPRDAALIKAINAAAAAAESQVIPFVFPETEKQGTVKAAAMRLVKALELPVNVGVHKDFPNAVLLSRGTLSNRGKRKG
ncbi:MAG: hypothetical protein ACYDAN_01860 [Candidatus Limnocylindrales bacterium]